MTSREIVPWKRLLAEAIAIVLSILLAFGIDAWWDQRNDRIAEREAIFQLSNEFEDNLGQLARIRKTHHDALQATQQLLGLTGPDPGQLPEETKIGEWLTECLTNATYDPLLGTITSLIASGRFQLIRDRQLQSMLAVWPAAIQDMIEIQKIEFKNSEDVLLPFTYDFVAWPDVDAQLEISDTPSRFDSDYQALFSSLRFEGMLTNRRYNLVYIISEIENLEVTAKDILKRLSSQDHR